MKDVLLIIVAMVILVAISAALTGCTVIKGPCEISSDHAVCESGGVIYNLTHQFPYAFPTETDR